MKADALIFTYLVSLLAALFALAVYSEMRRRRFGPAWKRTAFFAARIADWFIRTTRMWSGRAARSAAALNEAINF